MIAMKLPTLVLLSAVCAVAWAQEPVALSRVRGTLETVSTSTLAVRDAKGVVTVLPVADDLVVSEVAPIDPTTIQPGVFLGTTAIAGPDGSLAAVEVHVLPASSAARSAGHRVMDAQSGATMTNGSVSSVQAEGAGRTMTLRYPDGEKTVRVPEGVPVLTMNAGTRALLVPGAKVTVTLQNRDGRATAARVIVGHDGYVPPL